MLNPSLDDPRGPAPIPLHTAAELQDDLLTAAHDLDRLQTLLAHACEALMQGFHGANQRMSEYTASADDESYAPELCRGVILQLGGAITALQFQDMASQLIAHTHMRLRNCADRIARDAMGDDDEGAAVVDDKPLRPNPVVMVEMRPGSVELF